MSDRQSKFCTTVGVWPLLLLLSLALFGTGGCNETNSSSQTVNTGATVPSLSPEEELLRQLDKRFENPQVHYELARLYHRQGQWTKAEYYYEYALQFRPGFLAAQAGYAKLFMDEGQQAKGERLANEYIRQLSNNAVASTKLAWEFEALGLSDYAMECFQQALAADPDSAEVNKQMGRYYLDRGDKNKARQYLTRSIEIDPVQPDVAGELGRLGVVIETAKPEPERTEEAPDR